VRGILIDDEDEVSFTNIAGVICPLSAFRQRWKIFSEPAFPEVLGHYLRVLPPLTTTQVLIIDDIWGFLDRAESDSASKLVRRDNQY